MQLEKAKIFVLLVFAVDYIQTALSPDGRNVCLKTETYEQKIDVKVQKPKRIKKKKWCWNISRRFSCEQSVTKWELVTEQRTVNRTKIVAKCCDGYREEREDEIKCLPVCLKGCANGKCVAPELCTCSPGFYGSECEKECSDGFWGENCLKSCDCSNRGTCNKVDGSCNCEKGWTGDRCESPCQKGSYGLMCKMHCKCNNSSCHHITGECHATSKIYGETEIFPKARQTEESYQVPSEANLSKESDQVSLEPYPSKESDQVSLEPYPSKESEKVSLEPYPSQASEKVSLEPYPSKESEKVSLEPYPSKESEKVSLEPYPSQASDQVSLEPYPSQASEKVSLEPYPSQASDQVSLEPYPSKESEKVSLEPYPSQASDQVSLEPYPSQASEKVSLEPYPSKESEKVSLEPYPSRESDKVFPEAHQTEDSYQVPSEANPSRESDKVFPEAHQTEDSYQVPSEANPSRESDQVSLEPYPSKESEKVSLEPYPSRASDQVSLEPYPSQASYQVPSEANPSRESDQVSLKPYPSKASGQLFPEVHQTEESYQVPSEANLSKESDQVSLEPYQSKESDQAFPEAHQTEDSNYVSLPISLHSAQTEKTFSEIPLVEIPKMTDEEYARGTESNRVEKVYASFAAINTESVTKEIDYPKNSEEVAYTDMTEKILHTDKAKEMLAKTDMPLGHAGVSETSLDKFSKSEETEVTDNVKGSLDVILNNSEDNKPEINLSGSEQDVDKTETDNFINGKKGNSIKNTLFKIFHFLPGLSVFSGVSFLTFIIAAMWLINKHRSKAKKLLISATKKEKILHVEDPIKYPPENFFWRSNCTNNPVYLTDVDLNRATPVLETFKPLNCDKDGKTSEKLSR